MSTYNVKWILDQVADRLEFDSTEPDQAFGGTAADPFKRIRDWLNEFYTSLVNEVALEAPKEPFEVIHSFTWPSDQQEYELPKEVAWSKSLYLVDTTRGPPGEELFVYNSARSTGIWWKDRRTLVHPNSTGFNEDKTMEWHYLADAEELIDDAQEPILVPYRFRYLLVWGTAVYARSEVDEDVVPQSWATRVMKLKEDFSLDLCQGRLNFTLPTRIGRQLSSDTAGVIL